MRDQTKQGSRGLASILLLLSMVAAAPAWAVEGTQTGAKIGIDPYYTGSLLSPSPASSQAGLFAFEPYVAYAFNAESYGLNGGIGPKADKLRSLSTLTLLKYGITDSLSIQVIPTTSINYDQKGFNSGSFLGDTSAELEYLLTRQDKKTGYPSITASVGVNLPTGRFKSLYSSADGFGNGTYRLRLGLLAQSLLYGESEHPVRVRVYANGAIPLSSVAVDGFSTFGTDGAFVGRATSGTAGSFGFSVEYSLTQRLVFAFDVFHGFTTSNSYTGIETTGGTAFARGGNNDTTQLAPALEYSFNGFFGIIAGSTFSVEGRNTSTIIKPQIAFNFVFDTTKPDFGLHDIVQGVLP